MITAPHHNQQVFSDYYLDILLPQRHDWQELLAEAESVRQELARVFARYKPGDKEAQAEHDFIRPVLIALGHTFEVQASLATPDGTKQPDYIFYRDVEALNANKGKRLTDTLLQSGAFAVGDAKYWDCPLDTALRNRGGDPFTNKNPSYRSLSIFSIAGCSGAFSPMGGCGGSITNLPRISSITSTRLTCPPYWKARRRRIFSIFMRSFAGQLSTRTRSAWRKSCGKASSTRWA